MGLQTGTAWAAGNATSNGAGNGASNQPPGNNGTVKIDEYSMDPGQDNDPHVSCDFSVSFYGYDGGPQSATISVTPVAPTAGGHSYTTSTSWDVGTRTSGSQLDRNVTVTSADLASALAGVTPQAQQGYHLRLEVEVTGSQGSDDKYKVFWLQPCGPAASPASGSAGSVTTTGSSTTGSSTTASSGGATSTGSASSTASTASTAAKSASSLATALARATTSYQSAAAGTSTAAAAVPVGDELRVGPAIPTGIPAAVRTAGTSRPVAVGDRPSGSLAFTGSNLAGMSAAGLGLIGAGTVMTLRLRRKDRRPVQPDQARLP